MKKVVVKLVDGKSPSLIIDLHDKDRIKKVKIQLEALTKISHSLQVLSFLGFELNDEKTIEEYDIHKGSTIFLSERQNSEIQKNESMEKKCTQSQSLSVEEGGLKIPINVPSVTTKRHGRTEISLNLNPNSHLEENAENEILERTVQVEREKAKGNEYFKAKKYRQVKGELKGELNLPDELYSQFEEKLLRSTAEFYCFEGLRQLACCGAKDYFKEVKNRLEFEKKLCSQLLKEESLNKIENVVKDEMLHKLKEGVVKSVSKHVKDLVEKSQVDELNDFVSIAYTSFPEISDSIKKGILSPMSEEILSKCTLEFRTSKGKLETIDQLVKLVEKYFHIPAQNEPETSKNLETTKTSTRSRKNQVSFTTGTKPENSSLIQDVFTDVFKTVLCDKANFVDLAKKVSLYHDRHLRAGKLDSSRMSSLLMLLQILVHKGDKKKEIMEDFEKIHHLNLTKRLLMGKYDEELEKKWNVGLGVPFPILSMKMYCMLMDNKNKDGFWKEYHEQQQEEEQEKDEISLPYILPRKAFHPMVMCGESWPKMTPTSTWKIPPFLSHRTTHFEKSYYSKNHRKNRSLTWNFRLGNVEIFANGFSKRKYLLFVSVAQMLILIQFNKTNILTFKELMQYTGIEKEDLQNALRLLCVRRGSTKKVLLQGKSENETKGKGCCVDEKTKFKANEKFSSKKVKIRLDVISHIRRVVR